MSKVRARNRKRQIERHRKRARKLRVLREKYMAAKGKVEQDLVLKKVHVISPFYPMEDSVKKAAA